MNDDLTLSALVALIGWIPTVVLLFMLIPIRRALLLTMVVGWLLLPQAVIPVPGVLPDYDRFSALSAGALLALLILDFSRLAQFRPCKYDLPMLVWTVIPVAASLTNGLGAHDGVSAMLGQILAWTVFYFLGRVYLADQEGIEMMAMVVFVATLAYLPLVLYEIRMSPQLHYMVYGYHQHSFGQTYRLGGWRPMVFLQHGLALGMWLCGAVIMGTALYLGGALKRFQGAELFCLFVLFGGALWARSTGAIGLMLLGLCVIFAVRFLGSSLPLILVTLIPVGYIAGRTSGQFEGTVLVETTSRYVNPARAQSIEYRLENEALLIDRALERPLFGWGGWGRYRVEKDDGKQTVTDGFWILSLGRYGLLGLAAGVLIHLLPVWWFVQMVPARHWWEPGAVVPFGVALYLALYMVDNLLNAMLNPFTMLGAGALVGLLHAERQARRMATAPVPQILSSKELLQVPEPEVLEGFALMRWGPQEYQRRDKEARQAVRGLDPNDWKEWRLHKALFRRVILSVGRKQVDRFLDLPLKQQKGLALFLTGQGPRKPALK